MFNINTFEERVKSIGVNFPLSNTIGLARTALALGTLVTFAFNDIELIVKPLGTFVDRGATSSITNYSLFKLFEGQFAFVQAFSIVVLLAVISGWRPRVTCIFHAWVTFSLATSGLVIDGGDQVASILTILLIPICLADPRKWHWQNITTPTSNKPQTYLNIIASATWLLIRLQVAFIYFHASVGKYGSEEWVNGTSVYYWSETPLFSMPNWMEPWVSVIFENPVCMTLMTWGVLAFEVFLFMGIVIEKKWRAQLMFAGIAFHFGIALLYGLITFFLAMTGALLLFLGPQRGFGWSASKLKNSLSLLKLPSIRPKTMLSN